MLSKDFRWLLQEVKEILRKLGINDEILYAKRYLGFTTGSFMGRDDGYPETKTIIENSPLDFFDVYGTRTDEKYYILIPIPKEIICIVFGEEQKRIEEEEARKIEEKEMEEYKRLKEKFEKKGGCK